VSRAIDEHTGATRRSRASKRQSKKGEETGGRGGEPDDNGKRKKEGAHLSLEGLILGKEE
jgi:hypothetical protein